MLAQGNDAVEVGVVPVSEVEAETDGSLRKAFIIWAADSRDACRRIVLGLCHGLLILLYVCTACAATQHF